MNFFVRIWSVSVFKWVEVKNSGNSQSCDTYNKLTLKIDILGKYPSLIYLC